MEKFKQRYCPRRKAKQHPPMRIVSDPDASNFRILSLPTELVTAVCQHLPHKDLLNVRIVCHLLTQKSSQAFAQRYFRTVYAFLHPQSLRDLDLIANHDTYARYVHRITISTDKIYNALRISAPDIIAFQFQREKDMKRYGIDVKVLKDVLPLFPNLKNIVVTSAPLSLEILDPAGPRFKTWAGKKVVEPYDWDAWISPAEKGRAWTTVIEVLGDAEVQTKLGKDVDLELRMRLQDVESRNVGLWDVDGRKWKHVVKQFLRHVQLEGDFGATAWGRKFLESILGVDDTETQTTTQPHRSTTSTTATLTNITDALSRLNLHDPPGRRHPLTISTPAPNEITLKTRTVFKEGLTTTLHIWAPCQRLILAYCRFHSNPFVRFLRSHMHTLHTIQMLDCTMWSTWEHLLKSIRNLPRLSSLYLKNLYGEIPDSQVGKTFRPDFFGRIEDRGDMGLDLRRSGAKDGRGWRHTVDVLRSETVGVEGCVRHMATTGRAGVVLKMDLRKAMAWHEGRLVGNEFLPCAVNGKYLWGS
ncbi:hypothetical protein BCR34DRAFT_584674 [Clohesyomyces aquaticus]|uniref:F-box domain-containing protein n=1 Tax=Clohesyomyces aquaticus TaxID=1231657 RepID=A0A1Y2A0B4_9PLEO|nr:hypothetical protein BCR34DRAFT_584674 [Clohesyomyces aquaticus]